MTTQITKDMTAQGPVAVTPTALRAQLVALALLLDPTLTTDLPATLIEDIASTDVGALTVIDSAVDDLINSVQPRTANEFLLNQLGQIYGAVRGLPSNTSVFVVFDGPVGYTIQRGFIVSDGSHQYTIQDGGIIATGGSSAPLFAVATQTGAWAVPADTVNQLVTSVPASISLTVSNPISGTPQESEQTGEQYRVQVLQAGLAEAVGVSAFLRTQLENVTGVQARLISTRLVNSLWEVICGGGDPYEVAYAIYLGIGGGLPLLTGSVIAVTGITNANPGVVTTDLNHGYTSGDTVTITGVVGMSGINGVPYVVTVVTEKTFRLNGHNTTGSGAWTSGGVCSPNNRNISVSINDFPDTYVVPYVNPPQQTVHVALAWDTISPNFVSDVAVSQLATPAIVDYINSIGVGAPINIFELDSIFQQAVSSVVGIPLISKIDWTITINTIATSPTVDTGLIEGDPESYFYTDSSMVVVTQG